ncbi:MAG: L,D-transpeptidase/peptidoglycan binding protein [Acidimicrobiia bacterium]|nr:L,D-transpeptidase/peptidoglycan binding protein [Acidimicrobiia bacterium]
MATRQAAGAGAFAFLRRRALARPRLGRGPKLAAVAVFLVAAVLGAASAWAIQYDNRTINVLPVDTVIGGVHVGGLGFQAAVDKVRAQVEAPLHQPIHVEAEGFQADTTAWDMGLQVDVPAAVRQALAPNHDGNVYQRAWRRFRGADHRTIVLKSDWKGDLSASLIEQAKKAVAIAPRSARIDVSTGFVRIIPDVEGRALDVERAKTLLTEAVQHGDKQVQLPVVHPKAAVRTDSFATVILVRTGENKLYLYKNGQLAKTYDVATGRSEFPTPTGQFSVVSKQTNPTWHNPHDSWSASMPETIGPGPDNPLGTHALALSAAGILIHETPDVGSIGTSASHGCIRMRGGDELDVFNQVSVGTPVVIVSGGGAKARSNTPNPASAAQNAAVNY